MPATLRDASQRHGPRNAMTVLPRYAAMLLTAHSAMTPLPGATICFVVTKAMPTGASLSSAFATTHTTLEFEAQRQLRYPPGQCWPL